MEIIGQLASSLGRRDEIPNQQLAQKIWEANDKKAVKELVEHLGHKDKNVQSDCMKVIDEISQAKPGLVAPYAKELIALLDSKNNRLQWGAMTALDAIAAEEPDLMAKALPKIIAVADKGSVITNDHCVGILIQLCSVKKYAADAFSLLNERLLKSPTNQLPMYAEKALPVINDTNRKPFVKTLSARLNEIEKETKRARVEKVLKKVQAATGSK
jgi:HEAT repeat protein